MSQAATPLPSYRPRRDHLVALARRLEHLCRAVKAADLSDDFTAVERRLADATFKLLVIGEYKRGKSTLVNALLGKPLLPAGVIPLTSVITEIAYGDEPRLQVELETGDDLSVPIERLSDYVTEPGNPANEKWVRRVVVFDGGDLLADGVRIVDTPGIGSIHGLSTRAAYEYLDEADAVVFVLAADQPIGNEERHLLEAVRPVTGRVLFVLNRVDLVTPEELETAITFTKQQLAEACGILEASIHPFSARQALEARMLGAQPSKGFLRFAGQLHRLLVDERAAILLERTQRILLRAADLTRCAAQAERDATRLEASDLERAIARFSDGASQIRAREEEARAMLRHRVTRILNQTLREMEERTAHQIRATVWPRVQMAIDGSHGSLYGTTRSLAENVGDWVVEQMRNYYPESEKLVTSGFAEQLRAYERQVQELISEIVALADNLIGLRAPVPRATTALSDRPRFHFRAWDSSGPVLPRSRWLMLRLPRPAALRFARRWLAELMEKRIGQNLAGIRSDWMHRLDDAQWQLAASSQRQLEAAARIMTDALGRALDRKQSGLPQQIAREEDLTSILHQLDDLQDALRAGEKDGLP